MQNNRGNFKWSHDNNNALTLQERMMVEQQQQMLRNLNLAQGLSPLSTQSQVSPLLSQLSLLTSLGGIPNLVNPSNTLAATPLFPSNSLVMPLGMVPPPAMVPPPSVETSTFASGASKNSLFNSINSKVFASGNKEGRSQISSKSTYGNREELNERQKGKSRWDGGEWGDSDLGLNKDMPSSKQRQGDQSWFKKVVSSDDKRNIFNKASNSRDRQNINEDWKGNPNPWVVDERKPERSTELNRGKNDVRSFSKNFDDEPRRKAKEDDERFSFDLRQKKFEEQRWSSKSSQFEEQSDRKRQTEDKWWTSKNNQYEDQTERARQSDDNRRWPSNINKYDERTERQNQSESSSRAQVQATSVWAKESKGETSWSQGRGKGDDNYINELSSAKDNKRVYVDDDNHSLLKKAKTADERWCNTSRGSDDSWTNKSVMSSRPKIPSLFGESMNVWSKPSSNHGDEMWNIKSGGSEALKSWKSSNKDAWPNKSKSPNREAWHGRSNDSENLKRSNAWSDRPQNDKKPTSGGSDCAPRVWNEKARGSNEKNWTRKDIEDTERGETFFKETSKQNWTNNDNVTRNLEYYRDMQNVKIGDKSSNPPSNFLYPDPSETNASKNVWARLDTKLAEDIRSDSVISARLGENMLLHDRLPEPLQRVGFDIHLEGDSAFNQNVVDESLLAKVGILDNQLQQLDQKMLRLNNISSAYTQKEEAPLPSLMENLSQNDLRFALSRKSETSSFVKDSAPESGKEGGWTDKMVLIYPLFTHSTFSSPEVSDLRNQLSKRVLNLLNETNQDFQPRFLGVGFVNDGMFMIHCYDEETMNWVLSWKPMLTSPSARKKHLCVRKALDAVKVTKVKIYLEGVKDTSVSDIEFRIHFQNEHLETRMWKRGPHVVGKYGTTVAFFVDNVCLNLLKSCSWHIHYELSKVRVRPISQLPIPQFEIKRRRK